MVFLSPPRFSSCDGYVTTNQASTGIFTQGGYQGAQASSFTEAFTYTAGDCPTFAMGVSTTTPPETLDGATAVGGSVILALGAAAGVMALVL